MSKPPRKGNDVYNQWNNNLKRNGENKNKQMIKYRQTIFLELDRYPKKCGECPMFTMMPYRCHNERGMEGHCGLGYMSNDDMRDFDGKVLFAKCNMKNNPNVVIKGGNHSLGSLYVMIKKEKAEPLSSAFSSKDYRLSLCFNPHPFLGDTKRITCT